MTRLVLLASFLVACDSYLPLTLTLDGKGERYEKIVHDVVDAINTHALREVVYIGENGVPVTLACGYHNQNHIYFSSCAISNDASAAVVLVHEIGHQLGLPHVKDSSSIMYEFFVPYISLDAAAYSLVSELRRAGVVPPHPNDDTN